MSCDFEVGTDVSCDESTVSPPYRANFFLVRPLLARSVFVNNTASYIQYSLLVVLVVD